MAEAIVDRQAVLVKYCSGCLDECTTSPPLALRGRKRRNRSGDTIAVTMYVYALVKYVSLS